MKKLSILIILILSFTLYTLYFTSYTQPALAQCVQQPTNPRVQNGLITTPSFTVMNKFGSDTGQCVQSNLATFVPYRLPTYEDLKSKYYTQSKATKNPTASTTIDPIGTTEDGKVFDYTASDVEVRTPLNYQGTALIFVEGNIKISQKIIVSPSSQDKGLVFIVKGDVTIATAVTQIDAVIISTGTIRTAVNADGSQCTTNSVPVGASTNALIVSGSLVSLNPGSIVFCRKLDNDIDPAEVIKNQPKYLVILRDLMSDTIQKWSEVQ